MSDLPVILIVLLLMFQRCRFSLRRAILPTPLTKLCVKRNQHATSDAGVHALASLLIFDGVTTAVDIPLFSNGASTN